MPGINTAYNKISMDTAIPVIFPIFRFTDKHNGSANQIHRSMPIAPNKIRNSVIFISPLDSIINIKIF